MSEWKYFYKSMTVWIGVIGSALLATIATNQEDTKLIMVELFGAKASMVDLYYKVLLWITALKTSLGVTYGRVRKSKPLEDR